MGEGREERIPLLMFFAKPTCTSRWTETESL